MAIKICGNTIIPNTAGSNNNISVGVNSSLSITTGTNNVAIGNNSLTAETTGSNNIVIGYNLLNTYPSSGSNTFILGSDNNILMSGNLLTKN